MGTAVLADDVMTTGQALLVFVLLPVAFVALVWLVVSAPGWTRSGRATDAWLGDALVLDSEAGAAELEAAAVRPAQIEPVVDADDDEVTGGSSARW
jgi:hypothetical protein